MTRVSDALARAAASDQSRLERPRKEQDPGILSAEVPLDGWPAEDFAGEDTTPAEPMMQRRDTPGRETAAGPASWPEDEVLTEKLVSPGMASRGAVEQYRRLAARLHLAQAERGIRSVMITSAVVGEGKTLTATNLALTLSDSYKRRVLLIDADLRRPWVHNLLKLPNVTGLNDGIRDSERKVPLIRVSEYLSVLTAGRPDPDPMSVLSSDRMRRVLADASRSFDWVIVDTPPVALLSDAHLLATQVDAVVLVVKAGVTPLRAMTQSVEALGRDRILGVLLNCADDARQAAGYRYYGYANNQMEKATTV